ncbi:DUF305 domain-containing protein [Pseudonocardia sp. TRM90224]|uniref:DUF305 domain-containing protein n=1 Tax=Pseudonocardia sp. TRM90224 TaxID=2812678 RepID=UPI001E5F35CC|nr:DUF305 domain-containing protein [Pseudonocardia sp. TRM90224]
MTSAPGTADLDPSERFRPWHRTVVIIAVSLTLVLVGAIFGMLIRLPGTPAAPPETGSVDVGFAQDMTVHHQQAVQMAGWERDHSTDPVVIQLAADIEATQTGQIGRMQGWLELWGAAALPVGGHMAWMADTPDGHGHTPGAPTAGVPTMPGMATSQELRDLRAATGPDLDVKFLQLMLRHHQGGAAMLSYAAERATIPQVRNLAAQMLSSQSSETEYLSQLLAERGGKPLPL